MAPPLPPARPMGSGSVSDFEFQRYVDALGQMGQQQPQQPQQPMGSGSTTDMEKRAYQRYIDALGRLRAAEQPSDRPIGSGSTTDSEFQRYTAPPIDSGPMGDFTSGLPPEFSEATAAKNEYEKMRHYNRVMGSGSSSDAEWRAYEKATKPPSIGPLEDFFRSMRRKLP